MNIKQSTDMACFVLVRSGAKIPEHGNRLSLTKYRPLQSPANGRHYRHMVSVSNSYQGHHVFVVCCLARPRLLVELRASSSN